MNSATCATPWSGPVPELAPLKALARKLGLTQRVRFLTDVPDADLPALYNIATAYVGLSRQTGLDVEGFGISFAEAAACGCRSSVREAAGFQMWWPMARPGCW